MRLRSRFTSASGSRAHPAEGEPRPVRVATAVYHGGRGGRSRDYREHGRRSGCWRRTAVRVRRSQFGRRPRVHRGRCPLRRFEAVLRNELYLQQDRPGSRVDRLPRRVHGGPGMRGRGVLLQVSERRCGVLRRPEVVRVREGRRPVRRRAARMLRRPGLRGCGHGRGVQVRAALHDGRGVPGRVLPAGAQHRGQHLLPRAVLSAAVARNRERRAIQRR